MSVLPKLHAIYQNKGYRPMTGFNPLHFGGWMAAPFTRFIKGNTVVGMSGLALQEVMVVEGMAEYVQPRRILVIGNAHGWSTIALSLIFPAATIVAIDPGQEGNDLTRELAQANGLSITVVEGYSPQDVAPICAQHLSGPVDLVLIDAIHTNDAMLVDFEACRPHTHEGTIWLFHDTIDWHLVESFQTIRQKNDFHGDILTRTPSGLAVLWKEAPEDLVKYLSVFTEPPNVFRAYRNFYFNIEANKFGNSFDKL